MNYTRKNQLWINTLEIGMLIYAIIALVSLRMNGFTVPGGILLAIIVLNFLLSLVPIVTGKSPAIFCIITGILSVILLKGLVAWAGLILGILGIVVLIILFLKD